MEEKLTKERFIELCRQGGYCTKEQAIAYAGDRTEFTVHDIVEVYRKHNKFYAKEYDPFYEGNMFNR